MLWFSHPSPAPAVPAADRLSHPRWPHPSEAVHKCDGKKCAHSGTFRIAPSSPFFFFPHNGKCVMLVAEDFSNRNPNVIWVFHGFTNRALGPASFFCFVSSNTFSSTFLLLSISLFLAAQRRLSGHPVHSHWVDAPAQSVRPAVSQPNTAVSSLSKWGMYNLYFLFVCLNLYFIYVTYFPNICFSFKHVYGVQLLISYLVILLFCLFF